MMKIMNIREFRFEKVSFRVPLFTFAFLLFTFTFLLPPPAEAQRRDYLTDAEIELVRDAQQIDLRVEVLTKAIDRRFAILTNQPSPISKNSEKWGDAPKGTRTELISDISKILQKAVDDIDGIATREGGMDSKFFPKAVLKLAEAAERFLPQFRLLMDQVKVEKERGSILNSIDLCNQIIEAAKKLPKEVKKK